MTGRTIFITQGQYAVSSDGAVRISTLLGSCVACCLWDPEARVGGMNHILLARRADCDARRSDLAGINFMELLINDLLKRGARRTRLRAKAFGGAQMLGGRSTIGRDNAAFVMDFLARERIDCVSHSLGGSRARHIVFAPVTGIARVRSDDRPAAEILPARTGAVGNDPELF